MRNRIGRNGNGKKAGERKEGTVKGRKVGERMEGM